MRNLTLDGGMSCLANLTYIKKVLRPLNGMKPGTVVFAFLRLVLIVFNGFLWTKEYGFSLAKAVSLSPRKTEDPTGSNGHLISARKQSKTAQLHGRGPECTDGQMKNLDPTIIRCTG